MQNKHSLQTINVVTLRFVALRCVMNHESQTFFSVARYTRAREVRTKLNRFESRHVRCGLVCLALAFRLLRLTEAAF